MKHFAIITAMGDRLHYAPIRKNPENILDLGTGTGTWCVESMFTHSPKETGKRV